MKHGGTQSQKIVEMHIFHDEYITEVLKEKERILVSAPYVWVIQGDQASPKIDKKYYDLVAKLDQSVENRISQIKKALA